MLILPESLGLLVVAFVLGGLSMAAVATFLIVKEGLDATTQVLRRR